MLGWTSFIPASASLRNREIESGSVHEPLAKDLDRDRIPSHHVLAPIDAGEGSLGEVEEHLAAAVEEPGRVPLLKALDLPAREQPLAEQHAEERLGRAILGFKLRMYRLIFVDQPDPQGLLGQDLGVIVGHRRRFLL